MSFWFSCLPAKFFCICMFFSGIVFFLLSSRWFLRVPFVLFRLMSNMFCGLFILLSVLFYCSYHLFVLFFSNRFGLYNYFMAVVGWYSFLVSNTLLSCKLPINQSVEWSHHLNQRHFAHLWCVFGLSLVDLFARLLMVSLGWCFTSLVSLFCFSAFLTCFLCFVFYAANSFLPCKLPINHWIPNSHCYNFFFPTYSIFLYHLCLFIFLSFTYFLFFLGFKLHTVVALLMDSILSCFFSCLSKCVKCVWKQV